MTHSNTLFPSLQCAALGSGLTGAFRAGAQRRSPAQISKAGSGW